jgi:hypothetical protein
MVPFECELQDLPHHMAAAGLRDIKYRRIGTGWVAPDYKEAFVSRSAHRRGWNRDPNGGEWFPIEEPLPALPGTAIAADVSLALEKIRWGSIGIAIAAGDQTLNLWIDDVDDLLLLWVRFTQLLSARGQPHACLARHATALFAVQEGPTPGLCRFHVAVRGVDRAETIDVLTDRQALTAQFRELALAIADHPHLAHHYCCYAASDDANYDRVHEAAESEWEEGVKSGRFVDDFEQEEQFMASAIAAGLPLPEACARMANAEAEMLRTLCIPDAELVRYGLVDSHLPG